VKLAYQWLRDNTAISGAAASTYKLVAADNGKKISVKVTGSLPGYSSASRTSAQVTVAAGSLTSAVPTISGTAKVGSTLTAKPGTWGPSGVKLAYQWLREGSAISGATSSTYKLAVADAGKKVSVKVTGSLGGYSSVSKTSAQVSVAAGSLASAVPTISGTAKVGSTLTAKPGSWGPSGVKLAYQWLRDGSAISGATSSTYKLVAADAGKKISVKVTGTLAGYTTASKTSAQVTVAAATPAARFAQVVLSPDMTGDGRGEVIGLANSGEVLLHSFTASATLGKAVSAGSGFTGWRLFAPGDWSGDGIADIAGIDAKGDLKLFNGSRSGKLGSSKKIGNGWTGYRAVPAGDLNGDKRPDLLAIDPKGDLWLYPWVGTKFANRVKVGNGWTGWDLHAAGDLNNDGKGDILGIDAKGDLYRYLGRGDGTFPSKAKAGNGWGTYELSAGADLSGDKLADIVGLDTQTRILYYYKGLGGGGFFTKKQIATGW
jgi:hypothetical protein